jgi:hypothetical protein
MAIFYRQQVKRSIKIITEQKAMYVSTRLTTAQPH